MVDGVSELVEDQLDDLSALAAALTGDPDRAADLLGETIAYARSSPAAVLRDPDQGLRRLLVQRFVRRPADPPGSARPDLGEDISEDISEDQAEDLTETAARLPGLSPYQRAVAVLVLWDHRTHAEVGALLDRPPGLVARVLDSALGTLDAGANTVRSTIGALSRRTPDQEQLRRATLRTERTLDRRRGRRRWLVVAAALAVLVAAAVPVVRDRLPLYVRARGEWSYGLSITPTAGWQQHSHIVTPTFEVLEIAHDDATCQVSTAIATTAFPGDGDEQRSFSVDERVWINQRTGTYGTYGRFADEDGSGRADWAYGPGAVARTECSGAPGLDVRRTTLEIARRVHFERVPLRLPFSFTRTPNGQTVRYAGQDDDHAVVWTAAGPDDSFNSQALYLTGPAAAPNRPTRVLTVNQHPATLLSDDDGVSLCVAATAAHVCVAAPTESWDSTGRAPAFPVREATRQVTELADTMIVVTDLTDRSTWFDARVALPH